MDKVEVVMRTIFLLVTLITLTRSSDQPWTPTATGKQVDGEEEVVEVSNDLHHNNTKYNQVIN